MTDDLKHIALDWIPMYNKMDRNEIVGSNFSIPEEILDIATEIATIVDKDTFVGAFKLWPVSYTHLTLPTSIQV